MKITGRYSLGRTISGPQIKARFENKQPMNLFEFQLDGFLANPERIPLRRSNPASVNGSDFTASLLIVRRCGLCAYALEMKGISPLYPS